MLLREQKHGVREIARLGRDPGTISRDLRRNAATRGGKLEYRASVAHGKAELMARRSNTSAVPPSASATSPTESPAASSRPGAQTPPTPWIVMSRSRPPGLEGCSRRANLLR